MLYGAIVTGQTTHNVGVTSNEFTPANISINAGDMVVWTNTQGSHNVNGKQSTYPSNPESFGNQVAGAGWTYSHVFTIPGTYVYRCDPHVSLGMVGTVTVLGATGVPAVNFESRVTVFPNPVSSLMQVSLTGDSGENWRISIFNISGMRVINQESASGEKFTRTLDLSDLENGLYFLEIKSDSYSEVVKIIKE